MTQTTITYTNSKANTNSSTIIVDTNNSTIASTITDTYTNINTHSSKIFNTDAKSNTISGNFRMYFILYSVQNSFRILQCSGMKKKESICKLFSFFLSIHVHQKGLIFLLKLKDKSKKKLKLSDNCKFVTFILDITNTF